MEGRGAAANIEGLEDPRCACRKTSLRGSSVCDILRALMYTTGDVVARKSEDQLSCRLTQAETVSASKHECITPYHTTTFQSWEIARIMS
jgi:hypothetical protein